MAADRIEELPDSEKDEQENQEDQDQEADGPTEPIEYDEQGRRIIRVPPLTVFAEMIRKKGEQAGLFIDFNEEAVRMTVQRPGPVFGKAPQAHPHVDLDRYYKSFALLTPELREKVVDDVLAILKAKMTDFPPFEEALPNILPRLKLKAFYDVFELQNDVKGDPSVAIPHKDVTIPAHLAVELVYDTAETIATVTKDNLLAWEKTFSEVLDTVVARLTQRPPRWMSPPSPTGVFVANFRDAADAATMLCHETIRALAVKGEPVAMCPHRDVLMVTGADDPDGQLAMMQMVTETLPRIDRPITDIFRLPRKGARWVEYTPSPENPRVFKFWRNMLYRGLGQWYHLQKQLMDKIYERDDIKGTMMATLTVMQNKENGEVLAYSVWQKGAETFLPQCDLVMLCNPGNMARPIIGKAEFPQLMEMCGDSIEETAMFPKRWRCPADYWPTDEQINELTGDFQPPELDKDARKMMMDAAFKSMMKKAEEQKIWS